MDTVFETAIYIQSEESAERPSFSPLRDAVAQRILSGRARGQAGTDNLFSRHTLGHCPTPVRTGLPHSATVSVPGSFSPLCGGGGSEEGLTVHGLWGGGRYGPSLGPRWSKVDRGGLGVAGPASRALIRRLLAQWGLPSSSLAQQNEKCLCQSSQGGVTKTTVACCNRERPATGKNPCATCQEQGSPTLDAEPCRELQNHSLGPALSQSGLWDEKLLWPTLRQLLSPWWGQGHGQQQEPRTALPQSRTPGARTFACPSLSTLCENTEAHPRPLENSEWLCLLGRVS